MYVCACYVCACVMRACVVCVRVRCCPHTLISLHSPSTNSNFRTHLCMHACMAADQLCGVETLVRTNNRTEEAKSYGPMLLHKRVSREAMLHLHMTDTRMYCFFVHGRKTELWVDAGDVSTFNEWMVCMPRLCDGVL